MENPKSNSEINLVKETLNIEVCFWLGAPQKVPNEKDFLYIGAELPFQYPTFWRQIFCVDTGNTNPEYFTLFIHLSELKEKQINIYFGWDQFYSK